MNLWEFVWKDIKVVDTDGRVFTGKCDNYTSELDNPNGKESIEIGNTILYADEIASIEEVTA